MATHIAISLPKEYAYVLGLAGVLSYYCLTIGFMAGGRRKTLFTKEFMAQFEKEHYKECKQALPKSGYPDTGNGLFS